MTHLNQSNPLVRNITADPVMFGYVIAFQIPWNLDDPWSHDMRGRVIRAFSERFGGFTAWPCPECRWHHRPEKTLRIVCAVPEKEAQNLIECAASIAAFFLEDEIYIECGNVAGVWSVEDLGQSSDFTRILRGEPVPVRDDNRLMNGVLHADGRGESICDPLRGRIHRLLNALRGRRRG